MKMLNFYNLVQFKPQQELSLAQLSLELFIIVGQKTDSMMGYEITLGD